MRSPEILLIILVALLFIVAKPISKLGAGQKNKIVRQEQQEHSDAPYMENSYRVTYHVPDATEEDISDIKWLIRAAQVALDAGVPYFNVLEQSTHKRFSMQQNREFTVIEGTIQLLSDPMSTDYDANEILSLNLEQ